MPITLNTNDIAERFIFSILSADTTITSLVGNRIYNQKAPNLAVYPFILYSHQAAAADVLGMGAKRWLSPLSYLIEGVDRSQDYIGLYPIALRIDQLIDDLGQYDVPGGGRILLSTRVRPFKMDRDLNSVSYRYLGGMYRIEVLTS